MAKTKESRRRGSPRVGFRVTDPAEVDLLRRAARHASLPMGSYARSRALEAARREMPG